MVNACRCDGYCMLVCWPTQGHASGYALWWKIWESFITHLKKKDCSGEEQSFLNRCKKELLYLGNDSLECFGVIHGQVSENLTVDLDTSLVQKTHQLRIAQTLETSGSIDTLNPQ